MLSVPFSFLMDITRFAAFDCCSSVVTHWHISSCIVKREHKESNVKFLVIFQPKVPEVTTGIFFCVPGLGCCAGIILDLFWQNTGRALCRYSWVEGWQETLCTLGVVVFRRVLMAVESDLMKTTCLCHRLLEFPAPAAGHTRVIPPAQMPSLPAQCLQIHWSHVKGSKPIGQKDKTGRQIV